MNLADIDAQVMGALATVSGSGVYTDGVYTPATGGPVTGIHVAVDDLESETTGEVTQGGAVLTLLRSEVGTPVQGAEVTAGDNVWVIGRRLPGTDTSAVQVECKRK